MTDEAAAWVKDFQANKVNAPPNTILDVSMTETVKLDEAGAAITRPTYTVSKIHSIKQPASQLGLF